MSKTVWGLLYEKEGESPERIKVKNELLSFQRLIGGYIEAVSLPEWGGAVVVCDEEGKFKGLEAVRLLKREDGRAFDFLAGRFFVCSHKGGEFADLTERQERLVREYFE